MKNYLLILLFAFTGSITCCSQKPKNNGSPLDSMAKILNESIPKYKELYDEKGFYVSKGQSKNFFVYNLVNINNNSYPTKNPITLDNDGIYHFAPVRFKFSFSHIAIIKSGEMRIFRYLNCEDEGDDIKDVVKYLEDNFKYDKAIIEQVKNYRKHGMYFQTDPQSIVQCGNGSY